MLVEFHDTFGKDIDKLRDKEEKKSLFEIIQEIKSTEKFIDIRNIKKLKGVKTFYRIRLGDYRIGIEYKNQKIIFLRILLRKDIYKYFP